MSQARLLAAIGAVIVVAYTAETDRDLYVVGSKGTATFTNHSSTTAWLGGCARFDQEQLGPQGWIPEWGPDFVCVWEGTAQPVEPDAQVVGTFRARRPGVWRLAYPVGLQCDETQPLRSCAQIRRIHSNEFLVVDPLNACVVTGCSGHVCFPHHVATTCEWLPHYACFRDAHCGAFGPEGSCAWAPTLELRTCLADHGVQQRCGDGFLDSGEECDDSNTEDCDGCSEFCEDESLLLDSDGDGLADACDNCATTSNADQADTDGDGVGQVCDNCTLVSNPRIALEEFGPWMTLTGGQRDDDGDGFGNKCDAKFTTLGTNVGHAAIIEFLTALGKSRKDSTCGSSGTDPCARYDLDEGGATNIGAPDIQVFIGLLGAAPGPRCAACPLP